MALLEEFQFLIGTLKTPSGITTLCNAILVSIPDRYSKNKTPSDPSTETLMRFNSW